MAAFETKYASSSQQDLSCESSDFDLESNSSCSDVGDVTGIQPYQYEPDISETEEESVSSEDGADDLRLDRLSLFSKDWCQCRNCDSMGTIEESICCWEIAQMTTLREEKEVHCIIEHPGFHSLCMDRYVLQTCYGWYHQQYRQAIADENNRYRYTAYRMLTRFVWGWLGKDIRVTLPACAVQKIRNEFPSSDGIYTQAIWILSRPN